ncbi:MAG: hypothetical protein AB8H12_19910 [Lewinella sp.]
MALKNLWYTASICLSLLIAQGCETSCADEEVTAFFEKELLIIEDNLGAENIVGGRSMIAVFTLQKITGIQSSVRFGDTSVYPDFDAFSLDKSKWEKWLNKNGCELEADYVESVLQKVRNDHPYLI